MNKIDILTKCRTIAVCTKNHNWNNDEYEKGVSIPYKKIKAMEEQLELEQKEPDYEQIQESVEMLFSVFATKKTPLEEQQVKINELINETGVDKLLKNINFSVISKG